MSGGIPFDGLYGGAPAPADELIREGSAATRLTVALATTPPAPFKLTHPARTVLVDNPSGAWYRLNDRWLPPWTIGAVILMDLPDVNLEVIAGPPAGHFSVLAGEPLLLVALEATLAPHPGLAVTPHRSLVTTSQFDGGWSSNTEALVAIQAGTRRVMVDAISVGPQFVGGGLVAQYNIIRDEMVAILWSNSAGLGPNSEALAIGALSPESPSFRIAFEPGAIITELLRGVGIEVACLSSGGGTDLRAVLEYRIVQVA